MTMNYEKWAKEYEENITKLTVVKENYSTNTKR